MSNTANKVILIADDDPFIIKAFKAGLERYDYSVMIAEDGEIAEQLIASERPDLVLLDVIMPKKDGFEVLKTVKANPDLAHIPIIVLSSLAQDSDEETALKGGAAGFLVKSNVALNDILLRVQQLLEEADMAAKEAVPSVSTVPELGDAEALAIAKNNRAEAEAVKAGASGVPDFVPDITQPIPAEAEAEDTGENQQTQEQK